MVAGEVRSLAQRSAEAAKEIMGLISSAAWRRGPRHAACAQRRGRHAEHREFGAKGDGGDSTLLPAPASNLTALPW